MKTQPSTIPAAESPHEAAKEFFEESTLEKTDPAYQAYQALTGRGPATEELLTMLRGQAPHSNRARVALKALEK